MNRNYGWNDGYDNHRGLSITGEPLRPPGVEVVTERNERLATHPHYSDERFDGGPKTVYLAPGNRATPTGYGHAEVKGLTYHYSDRMAENDASKFMAAHTAAWYEAMLTHYWGEPCALVHVLAGVVRTSGHSYYVLGYRRG